MGKRILLIDDDLVVQTLIAEFLTASGQSVVAGATGAACLPMIREIHPDIVFLDYQLPDRSGLEVLREIRGSKDVSSVPVAFMSADTNTQKVAEKQNLRADWYLTKPFDLKIIAEILKNL